MSLLLAGIDEAGYGPMLGPLCVGFSLFRIHEWTEGDPAPCLWQRCASGICRKPSDSRKRLPIADSKALKLPNETRGRHPLLHLERGTLALLRLLGHQPASDTDLLAALSARHPSAPWYAGDPIALPLGSDAAQIAIAANRASSALQAGGVELLDARCIIVPEDQVNSAIRDHGSKAHATLSAVGGHVRHLLAHPRGAGDHLRIVCDQLGGRTQYQQVLARELPGCEVTPLVESGERSRYVILRRFAAGVDDTERQNTSTQHEHSAADHAPIWHEHSVTDHAPTGHEKTGIDAPTGHENPGMSAPAGHLDVATGEGCASDRNPWSASPDSSSPRRGEGRPASPASPAPPSPIIQFMPEAETHHLPVAFASMIAKLIRELSMMRFNRYWCSRLPELKPTAGYYSDAARWLRDAHDILSPHERAALIRRA